MARPSPGLGTQVLGWILLPLLLLLLLLLLPVLPVVALGSTLRGLWLRGRWHRMHGRFGRTVLLVYSRSPNWQSYIEAHWLPRLVANAVVLDWSDRSTWRRSSSLVVRVFRHWAPDRDFNPMAILLPPRGRVRVLGFRRAFRDLKHGKEHSLRRAEAELFEFVERGR